MVDITNAYLATFYIIVDLYECESVMCAKRYASIYCWNMYVHCYLFPLWTANFIYFITFANVLVCWWLLYYILFDYLTIFLGRYARPRRHAPKCHRNRYDACCFTFTQYTSNFLLFNLFWKWVLIHGPICRYNRHFYCCCSSSQYCLSSHCLTNL